MDRFGKATMKRVLIALFAIIVAGGVAQAVYIDAFNKTPHMSAGGDETQQTYLKFNDREDSTSKWVKRDYDLHGQTVDVWAQTVDGTLFNNSEDAVASWEMTINITHDCFVNNAWVGTVEIHQFVGTEREAVQTLDLRSYNLEDIELTYLYDGDLLIPLQAGDFIVYHPNAKDELEVAPHGDLTMGMIFYFLDDLDLSDYEIEYYYHRDFTYGAGFVALAVLAILWVFLLVGTLVADASYKRALREMELRKSSLATMSSIYSIISFIDLDSDQMTNVYTDPDTKSKLLEGAGAREKLLDIFGRDTAEAYRAAVLEFIDIATLPERLEKESIACEYVSKRYGWSSVRLFAAEREEGQPLTRVLLTIQDINDEKRQLDRFEERAANAERENLARNAFVMGVSSSLQYPIREVLEFDEKILNESSEEQILAYARQIKSRTRLLSYMAQGAVDSSRLAAGDQDLVVGEYSLEALVADVADIAKSMLEDKELDLQTDVPKTFPDRLVGDALGIERALIGLFAYAIRKADVNAVKLSVFGKQVEDTVHLLFSVRMNESAMTADEARSLEAFVSGLEEGHEYTVVGRVQELEMAAVQLALAGTRLHAVNEPGEECEFYFEIEQGVALGLREAGEDGRAE